MQQQSFTEVFKTVGAHKASREFPPHDDKRSADGWLWPILQPTFGIDPGPQTSVFTIGSCFARNIEEALQPLGFSLPTRALVTPAAERGAMRPNAVLNEFNPGTMQQRILYALAGRELPDDMLVPSGADAYADLLLVHGVDVPRARALARRAEITDVYRQLPRAHVVVITLGLVEAWFDRESGLYLNRMPPVPVMKSQPERYEFRRLDASDCVALLEPAIDALVGRGLRVVLTVSPVPLHATMTGVDAVTANEASKAALRVCADALCRRFSGVDYFPSYEIVRSGGLSSYESDQLHVKSALVHRITQYMIAAYCSAAAASTPLARTAA